MKPADNIDNLFENSKITVGSNVDKKILNKATSALPRQAAQPDRNRWSIIMHSRMTKLSGIAAAILLIVILTIVNKTAPKAWAIEQTIDAFKEIHTVKMECYEDKFGHFVGYLKRTGEDWTSFEGLGETEGATGVMKGGLFYNYFHGAREISEIDYAKEGFDGPGARLFCEASKVAPTVLPLAKTLLQTFKMLASEWKETYKIDDYTGRDSVFVNCTYEPLSMSFEAVFDIETKLLVRAKIWKNTNFHGRPALDISKVTYNASIPEEQFDLEKRFGVPIVPHEEWKKRWTLFRKGYQLEEEKPEEAIRAFQELYNKYPNYWNTPESLNMIGIIYKNQKQYNKAIKYHQTVLNEYTYPEWAISDAYYNIGDCYKNMNETDKAIKAFEKCLEIHRKESEPVEPEISKRHHAHIKHLENTIEELKNSL